MLHPLMLAWGAGASIPLVLHLLSRSQYKPVAWGAMMFLSGAEGGSRYSARLKQWTLLLLRMGMIGLLAVALARPVVAARYSWVPTAGLTTGGPAAVVIILDDSASMGYSRAGGQTGAAGGEDGGASRLDEARQVTLQILSSLKRGDEATLMLSGARDGEAVQPTSADLQSIAGRVENLEPDTGQADFAVDLLRAADLLDHSDPVNHEIYVVCDQQASSWRNLTDGFRRQWRGRRRSSPLPRVTVIPVGGWESDNVAMDGIEIGDHAGFADEQNYVRLRVHNYGPALQTGVPVSVWMGNRTLFETSVTIGARSEQTLILPIRLGEPGSRVISAAVKSTGLTSDDRVDYALDVREAPRVLVVSAGGEMPGGLRELLPQRRGAELSRSVSVEHLSAKSLADVNEVVLVGVSDLSAEQAGVLRGFAGNRGGVLILPGEDMGAASEGRLAVLGSEGLIHAKVIKLSGKMAGGTVGAMVGAMAREMSIPGSFDMRNAMFRFLPEEAQGGKGYPALGYLSLQSSEPVVARYATGAPMLMPTADGQRRVMLLNAVVDWNKPVAGNLGLLVQSVLRHLVSAGAVDRNLSPGQSIVVQTGQVVDDRSATVSLSYGGPREPAVVVRQNNLTEIRFNRTSRAGMYRVRYRVGGKETALSYVVSAGRADSDLTPLTESGWKVLQGRVNLHRVDLSQTTILQTMDIQRGGREIWIDLLGGVLVLMGVEMVLGKFWSG